MKKAGILIAMLEYIIKNGVGKERGQKMADVFLTSISLQIQGQGKNQISSFMENALKLLLSYHIKEKEIIKPLEKEYEALERRKISSSIKNGKETQHILNFSGSLLQMINKIKSAYEQKNASNPIHIAKGTLKNTFRNLFGGNK